jgi:hypothetical protein
MKQRLYGFSVLVAVLAALTLSGTATAGGKEVPFKGRSSGVIVPATCLDPNDSCTVLYGEGEATPLGPFTVTARVVQDAETVTGPWMLTTADGDVLFVTFEGFAGEEENQGRGEMTIVGGTGRFQGATGHYTQLITFSDPEGTQPSVTYTDVLEGTISFGRHRHQS